MALSRAKMKEKLIKRTKAGASRRGRAGAGVFKTDLDEVNFFNCKEGDHILDIIPYEAGPNDPITPEGDPTYQLEIFVHRGVGPTEDQRVLCLRDTYGQPCPICDHRRQLQTEGADEAKWKPLFAKQRNIYNILCYSSEKEEAKGIQVWEVAWFYMEKHLAKLAKGPMQRGGRSRGASVEPNVAFADPDEGKSISFSVESQGKEFPEYSGHQFEARDYVIDDGLLEEAHCLDDLIIIPTYDEVYELYWGEPPEKEDGDEEAKEEVKETGRRTKPAAKTTRKKTSAKTTKKAKPEPKKQEEKEPEEVEAEEAEEAEEENICPIEGNAFGVDHNTYEYCDDCDLWEACANAAELALDPEPDPDPEPEPEPDPKPKKTRGKKAPAGRRRRR